MSAKTNVSAHKSVKSSWWKRLLKYGLYMGLVVIVPCGLFLGALVLKHKRIVAAKPGKLPTKVQPTELGRRVNPFIGTGGTPWVCGNNFPGAMVPFGMVRLGPETVSMLIQKRALNTSGYYYGDDQVLGFSHTRLNGTGATDGGHFLVIPAIEPIRSEAIHKAQTTAFSHSDENASPGYYSVKLLQPGILVELTATHRVGIHRYTFEPNRAPHLRINVMNALGNRPSSEGQVRVLPKAREVEGSVRTFGTFGARYGGLKVYMVARFDQPFTSFSTWRDNVVSANVPTAEDGKVGVDVEFTKADQPQTITLKVAISHVSIENARANLEAEAATKTFDQLLAEAQHAWDQKLSLIKVHGGTDQQQTPTEAWRRVPPRPPVGR